MNTKERKFVFFAFEGEKMCFSHLLINALDLHEKGYDVKLVIEGKATKLIKDLIEEDNSAFKKARELGIVASVCKACANAMGVLEFVEEAGLPINDDLFGHPPMEPYLSEGYELIVM